MKTKHRNSKDLAVTQLVAPVVFLTGVFAMLSVLSTFLG